jgi:putative transposase
VKALYPAQQRSKAALHALAIVNGDGYKHNVWVRFADGEIVRAKTWFWQDVYSGKILAWRTDKTEHTDMIRLAFGDLVERGASPRRCSSTTRSRPPTRRCPAACATASASRCATKSRTACSSLLGVDVHTWATPGHGQAKPVERAFGTGGVGEYVDKAPELAAAPGPARTRWTSPTTTARRSRSSSPPCRR